ncbi:MAG TPA: transcriptional regulator [Bordetella sp.]
MQAMDDKQAFAERLKKALKRSHKKIETPTDLATQFSLRSNEPVTPQAAQKWLSGRAIPTPDKISILAEWLDVSEKWLRHGVADEPRHSHRGRPAAMREPQAPSAAEWTLLERLRQLPEARRKLVEDLVEQLSLDAEVWKRS